jgi:hypothetical protein
MRRLLTLALLLSSATASAATFSVGSTDDAGPQTLRQAILDASANPGADTIAFNGWPPILPPQTIVLSSALPDITEAVTIDGYSFASNPNTRGQMAVFLNKALRLP